MTTLQKSRPSDWIPQIPSGANARDIFGNDLRIEYVSGTGHASTRAVFVLLGELQSPASTPEPSIADRIAHIRHLLSLSVTEFAHLAGIERPHAYAWMDGTSKPQPANMRRLEQLERVANGWKELTGKSIGRLMHERLRREESTLFELLGGEIDEDRIEALLPRLALRDREREAMSVKARLAAAGMPDVSEERQAGNLLHVIRTHGRRR